MKLITSTQFALSKHCLRGVPLATTSNQSRQYSTNRSTNKPASTIDTGRGLAYQLRREWKVGDVYAPHDLSGAEQRKWGQRKRPEKDVFDILAIDPLSLYKNISVMTDFVTETGRIKSRSETGLRPVNQRKIAKAIRRAIALGLMPSAYKHPMLIKAEKGAMRRSFQI